MLIIEKVNTSLKKWWNLEKKDVCEVFKEIIISNAIRTDL